MAAVAGTVVLKVTVTAAESLGFTTTLFSERERQVTLKPVQERSTVTVWRMSVSTFLTWNVIWPVVPVSRTIGSIPFTGVIRTELPGTGGGGSGGRGAPPGVTVTFTQPSSSATPPAEARRRTSPEAPVAWDWYVMVTEAV
jgi:hypothetical protein